MSATPKPKGRPAKGGPGVVIRVPTEAHAALLALAKREGLTYGGQPSASRAVVRLIEKHGR